MIACYKGHIQIAKYLLSLNADVNRKSVKGNTALHDCAESGSLHILKMLLAHGATMDVDSYGEHIWTSGDETERERKRQRIYTHWCICGVKSIRY